MKWTSNGSINGLSGIGHISKIQNCFLNCIRNGSLSIGLFGIDELIIIFSKL